MFADFNIAEHLPIEARALSAEIQQAVENFAGTKEGEVQKTSIVQPAIFLRTQAY